MRSLGGLWILVALVLLIDVYVFQGVKTVTIHLSAKQKQVVTLTYWLFALLTVAFILMMPFLPKLQTNKVFRNYIFSILVGIFLAKLICSVFLLADDVRRLIQWLYIKASSTTNNSSPSITRSQFMSWIGFAFGSGLFTTLLYGFKNKYNYQIVKQKLAFAHLPALFDGFRIVHISDIHSGSFQDKEAVQKGVDMILKLQPDLILFTGDLVNDRHEEMHDYIQVFNQLKAKHGVFSVLGNHDYGDYVSWPSPEAKQQNLEQLKQIHAQLGWRLLMNEHVAIQIEHEKIGLLGIENWGAKGRFPKYGKMHEAYANTHDFPFKILMSHDPSHWDAEIKPKYADIDLTLSGHTHGMQFGIENPYFKWSPVQWMYKQWAGLYEEGNQKLYVNRGFGFIGYPGRVGIMPEITCITLHKA